MAAGNVVDSELARHVIAPTHHCLTMPPEEALAGPQQNRSSDCLKRAKNTHLSQDLAGLSEGTPLADLARAAIEGQIACAPAHSRALRTCKARTAARRMRRGPKPIANANGLPSG